MHIVGVSQIIRFPIAVNASPPAQSTYDIQVQKPDGTSYVASNVTTYQAPTGSSQGFATYAFTPDIPGRWVMTMSSGTTASNSVDAAVEIYVIPAIPDLGAGVTALHRQAYPPV